MFKQLWKNLNLEMKNKDWILLLTIIIGAILFRLVLMTKAYAIGFDEVNYLKLAATGKMKGLNHVLHTYWSPFYPATVALFSFIIHDIELAGRLLSILCGSLVIIPLFFFVKSNFTKKIAYGVALFTACYSFSAHFSVKAETDFLYSFLAISGIILGWNILKNKQSGKSFVVGLLFGLAYLTRPEGIGFLITFWVIIFIILIFKIFNLSYPLNKEKLFSYISILLLSGLGFGIISFPYLIYLHQETGTWTISTKGTVNQQGGTYVMNKNQYPENPFHTLSQDNTRLLQDEIYHLGNFVKNTNQQRQAVVKISISGMAKKVFENFYKLISQAFTKVLPLPLVFLLALGLFQSAWTKESALLNLYLLSFIFFFWFMVIPLFHITLRYFVPLLPISFIWITKGVYSFSEWFSTTIKNSFDRFPTNFPLQKIGLLLVIAIILVSAILPELGKHIKKNKLSTEEWAPSIEQKKAGFWLRQNGVKNPIIMAYNHAVSFYAGNYNITESVEIPENKIDRILEYARYRGVNYLVLNDRYKHHFPLIAHLYDQKEVPPDLQLIYEDQQSNGLRTLIYELKKSENKGSNKSFGT